MTMELLHQLYTTLPVREKFLVPIGATISWASIALSQHLSAIATLVGILVGLATLCLTILRICSAWSDLREKKNKRNHDGKEK